MNLSRIKNKIIYSNFSFDLAKAQGSYLWDHKGNKFIDFVSGWNVTNLGWNHPEITEAVIKQAKKNVFAPMWMADLIQNEYADLLTKSLPEELDTVAKATGGTEANEEAIKTARAYTSRKKIIGFKESYHGQSLATLSIGYPSKDVEAIAPLVEGFVQIDFPKKNLADFVENLEKLLAKREIAAVISEAGIITGWGSTCIAPDGFLRIVRNLTKKYGTLLILDEVGTGFSRCGKLFAMELEQVTPDIVTFAKGMSNGAGTIGAMVTTRKIAEKSSGKTKLISTFGWIPIACAAALKTLQIHLRDKVWEKAEKDGEYIINTLKTKLKNNIHVEDIRGKGMIVGIEFVRDKNTQEKYPEMAEKFVFQAGNKGLYVYFNGKSNTQIMPPLTIERKVLDQGLDILLSVIKSL